MGITSIKAQQSVSGVVSDKNFPLPQVNISIEGTTKGTTTDFDGNYTLNSIETGQTIVYSYIGYTTKKVLFNGQKKIDVVLDEDTASLSEVVIVGYGSQIKKDLTSAISTLKAKEITQTAVASNPVTALQGRAPGIQVESFGGQPGGKANVFIRGVNSLSNASPLFLVDGLFVDDMQFVNPNDIKNISILKDAAAAAIYGSRAANGVILIETNHGRYNDKIEVKFTSKIGVDTPSKKLDFINGQQYTAYLNQRFRNDQDPTSTEPVPQVTWNGVDTDWQDENISPALVQDYGLTVSGGGANSSQFFSFNYFDQDGILVGSGFERINLRFNSKYDKNKFHVTQSVGVAQGKLQENNWYGFDGTTAPTVALRNPNNEGGFEAPSTQVQGPGGVNQFALASLEENETTTRTIFGNVKLEYDLTDYLTAGVTFGVDYRNIRNFQFTPTFVQSRDVDPVRNLNEQNDLTDFRTEELNFQVEPTLNFNKDFGRHKLGAVLGYTYFEENSSSGGLYGQNTPANSVQVVSALPPSDQIILLGEESEAALISYFGRINYNYDSKYLFSATMRRDASSRFAEENRVGYFPSFSAGWNISNEGFWKSEVVNYLKLRASYGELGSYSDVAFPFSDVFTPNQSNTSFGGQQANGLVKTTVSDPDIKWETTKTFDIGVDASFFDNAVNFSADYYAKDIEDVLVEIAIPSTAGTDIATTRNAGNLINKGIEFSLDYKKRNGDFTFKVGTNFSFNIESQAGNIPNPILGPTIDEDLRIVNRTDSNQPIGAFYGFIVEDSVNPTTGDFVRKNLNGDLDADGNDIIDEDDLTVIGDPVPDFTYGFTFDAEYKNFDLGLNFVGVQGNEIYNLSRYYNILWQDGGKLTDVLNAWTPSNTNTNIPRASVSDGADNKAPSSFFVEDGSYFRLKTLEIGYNFKDGILGNDLIKDLRLSFNIQNVFVLTDYSGYDPDVSSTDGGRASLNSGVPGVRDEVNPLLGRGLDARAYPNARTFTLGIQATF